VTSTPVSDRPISRGLVAKSLLSLLMTGGCFLLAASVYGEDRSPQTPAATERDTSAEPATGELRVNVRRTTEQDESGVPLPVRVVVTASDGTHPDGSGHGVYADGRFFAEGEFTVRVPPGMTRVELKSGPNFVPHSFTVDVSTGGRIERTVMLTEWFNPARLGWYCGDNHVHAQHDATAAVKTGLNYTSLQGRANGLNWITESGSNVSYAGLEKFNTGNFLLRIAPELRPGPFVGHLNTPGIHEPIPQERSEELFRRPLPALAALEEVHRLGGVVIRTHPMSPPHQLHWMGAAEVYSDAVLGQAADLFDVDSEATQQFWFAVLNLGNRIGVSSYTDCALGRLKTMSPGDRRVYCRPERFDYESIVEAMRKGRTFATNGGPLFAFLEIDGHGSGETIQLEKPRQATVRIRIHSLHPLQKARLYGRGALVHEFDVRGRKGEVELTLPIELAGTSASWYALRVEDEQNHWALTSPVYVDSPAASEPGFRSAVLLEIHNAERFTKLRKEFFAHMIVTISPDEKIETVVFRKEGETVRAFLPEDRDRLHAGRIPVTQINGPYGPGWVWFPNLKEPYHFQADLPVVETGWYSVVAVTTSGRVLESQAIRFDASNPNSHALSAVRLSGRDTLLTLEGYGEEMPLAGISEEGTSDNWWYPQKTYFRQTTTLAGEQKELQGGSFKEAREFFRASLRDRTE